MNSAASAPGSAATAVPALNAARSSASGVAGSPSGGTVTVSVASARP
jgi:hypothetical protein